MLDKNLIYVGYSLGNRGRVTPDQPPYRKFKRVKILYEDAISWYVKDLTRQDSRGNGIHYSVKKHCFCLLPIRSQRKKIIKLESCDLLHILELTEASIRTPVDRIGIICRANNWLKIRAILYHLLRLTEVEGNAIYYKYEKKCLENRIKENRR